MEPEKIPLEEALARGQVPCAACGVAQAGVRRVHDRLLCAACAKKDGRAAAWIVGGVVVLALAGAAWLVARPSATEAPSDWTLQVNALLSSGRAAEARDLLAPLLEASPRDPGLNIYMGHCLIRLGRPEPALGHFRTALEGELDPDTKRMGEVWVGIALHKMGRSAEALPHLQAPVRSAFMEAHRATARVEALLDLERYDEALALLPAEARDPAVLEHRYKALRYAGRAAEADRLLASLPPDAAWAVRVVTLREDGRFADARVILDGRRLQAKPGSPDAVRAARADLALRVEQGDLDGLEKSVAELLAGPPSLQGHALYFRALGQLIAGRRDDARTTAAAFLERVDPAAAVSRLEHFAMRHLVGKATAEELEAEAKAVPRFAANDLYYYLAVATGDRAWAVKGLEATPGRNFPYHALKRLAGP